MRSSFLPGLALLATASAPLAAPAIRSTPVPLDRADPARVRLGGLRYLGGWELTSEDRRFGGLSAMVWQGDRLIAISDSGTVFALAVGGGAPVGRVLGPLPDGPDDGSQKTDRDAESLAADPATGRLWVGFEAHNAIWRYDARLTRAEARAKPAAMRKWPSNGGAEAMLRLPDGRFLVFAEQARGPVAGTTVLLVFAGDPADRATPPPGVAAYRPPEGHAVTDAALLPDGRLILLHRRATLMSGLSAKLSIVDPRAIRAGAIVGGREIAHLATPLTADNMEAIAVRRERRATILWIASDDNFSPLQRTLLLKFALVDEKAAGDGDPGP